LASFLHRSTIIQERYGPNSGEVWPMEERRLRSWWVVRQRYQRAAWLAAFLGAGLALVPVYLTFRDDGVQALTSMHALATSAALLAAGFFVPRWIVLARWRQQRLRHMLE
jgi:hypothetical protein